MAQISYTNKVALNENPEILDINKVTDDDMNEIKQVVNDNYNNTIQITDTEPTDSDNKLWIDTGEVESAASEITNEYSTSIGLGYSANYINNLHTYSTTEQRIGTWIDGKPLYRRTYDVTLGNTTRDQIALSGLLRDYNIIKYDGEMYNQSNDNARPLTQYYVYQNIVSYSSVMFFKDSSVSTTLWTLNIWHSEAFANFKCRIIVEYTKPTD